MGRWEELGQFRPGWGSRWISICPTSRRVSPRDTTGPTMQVHACAWPVSSSSVRRVRPSAGPGRGPRPCAGEPRDAEEGHRAREDGGYRISYLATETTLLPPGGGRCPPGPGSERPRRLGARSVGAYVGRPPEGPGRRPRSASPQTEVLTLNGRTGGESPVHRASASQPCRPKWTTGWMSTE